MKRPSVGRDTSRSCTKCEFLCHVVGLGGVKSILHSKGECVDCTRLYHRKQFRVLSSADPRCNRHPDYSLQSTDPCLLSPASCEPELCRHQATASLLSICSYADLILRAATFMHRRCKSKYVASLAYESEARDLILC